MNFTTQETERLKNLKTPFYYYQLSLLEKTLKLLTSEADKYGYHIHYAMKANANEKILKIIQEFELGADCVSGNEIKLALKMGFQPEKIVFAGVGKTDDEINSALESNIFCFNCESIEEIEIINERAKMKNKQASIAVRINPNVNAHTHEYISTALDDSKFGIHFSDLEKVMTLIEKSDFIELKGLHFHIGSQITDLTVFKRLCYRVNEIQEWFLHRGVKIEHLNLGGGLGIDYENPEEQLIPDFKAYFKLFHDFLQIQPGQKLHFELGRSIVGQCGHLVSKVLFTKKSINTHFIILDSGMTELIRPALYQAYHKITHLTSKEKSDQFYNVVGPICESSDCFGKNIALPPTARGDLLVVHSTGAYGQVMASNYNLRKRIKAYYGESF